MKLTQPEINLAKDIFNSLQLNMNEKLETLKDTVSYNQYQKIQNYNIWIKTILEDEFYRYENSDEIYKDNDRAFLVALETGGIMESPDIEYSDYKVVIAKSKREAEIKYNKKMECNYFYGKCLKEISSLDTEYNGTELIR